MHCRVCQKLPRQSRSLEQPSLKPRLAYGLVAGIDDLAGLVGVGGLLAGALAGDFVHAIAHAAPEAVESNGNVGSWFSRNREGKRGHPEGLSE